MATPFETSIVGSCLYAFGELDATSVPRLERDVVMSGGRVQTIDLADVSFIDSSGIRELIVLRRRYPHLEVRNPSDTARRLMDVIGVSELILTSAA